MPSPPQKEKEDLDESGNSGEILDLIGGEDDEENEAAQDEEAKESSVSDRDDKYSNKEDEAQIKSGSEGEKYALDDAVDKLLDTSMQEEDDFKTDTNFVSIFKASENIEPLIRKSIMKKPATPVPRIGTILGKRTKNNQSLEELINQCNQEENDDSSDGKKSSESNCLGATSANMGQKRVKFNKKHDKVYEFEVESEEEDPEANQKKENASDEGSYSINSEDVSEEICGSDNEDMEKGLFFDYIERERKRHEAERKYIVYKLRSKQRVGSIFIDKVKRVIAAI